MNNGHEGALWGIHASSPRDALARPEMMCTMHDISLPLLTLRGMIASAVKIVTYQKRLTDGIRRMSKIAEVLGLQGGPSLVPNTGLGGDPSTTRPAKE